MCTRSSLAKAAVVLSARGEAHMKPVTSVPRPGAMVVNDVDVTGSQQSFFAKDNILCAIQSDLLHHVVA